MTEDPVSPVTLPEELLSIIDRVEWDMDDDAVN
jgi:hypothetical protein